MMIRRIVSTRAYFSGRCGYSSTAKPLEIELKFRLDAATKNRIQSLPNIKFLSFQEFEDIYYDSDGYQITTRDVWLRKRVKAQSSNWEMKVPIDFRSLHSKKVIERPKTDQYYEMESKLDIARFLQEEKLVQTPETRASSIDDLEASSHVRPFAKFGTKRTKYSIDNITIDLDEADFGYSIGELEILVSSPAETAAAEKRIHELADNLKLNSVGVVRGKLIEFIFRKDKVHYDALRVSGVLR